MAQVLDFFRAVSDAEARPELRESIHYGTVGAAQRGLSDQAKSELLSRAAPPPPAQGIDPARRHDDGVLLKIAVAVLVLILLLMLARTAYACYAAASSSRRRNKRK